MRFHCVDLFKHGAGTANQLLLNLNSDLSDISQQAFVKQSGDRFDGSHESVFNRGQQIVGEAFINTAKKRGKCWVGHELNLRPEQLNCCVFTERAMLALKSYSRPMA